MPDLITCAKGVSSGYLPLSATIVSGDVRAAFWDETAPPFLHGSTYAGHPAACAAALVNLDIIEREGLVERAARLEPVLAELLEPLRDEEGVSEVRSAGLAAAVELDASVLEADPGAPLAVTVAARRHGVLTRALRGVALQISPPLVVAAIYELTPLKDVCLGKCRSPLGFLLGSWRDGVGGALRMRGGS